MKLPLSAPVVLSLLLVTGCGGSSPGTEAEDKPTPTTPTSSSAAPDGGSSGQPTASGTAGATRNPGRGATAGPSGAASTTAAAAPAEAAFTAPGTYTYESRGTVTAGTPRKVDGTAELKVDKPNGNKQHSTLGGEQGGTEQDVVHLSSGTYLARLLIGTPGQSKEFRPAKPVLGHPRPAAVGKAWSWSMTSTDGKTRAAYSAKIVRQESLTIGGTRVAAWVIDSSLKLTGDFTYTERGTTWYDETRLLRVKTRSQGSGSFSGIAFTTDVTNTLRSVKPS